MKKNVCLCVTPGFSESFELRVMPEWMHQLPCHASVHLAGIHAALPSGCQLNTRWHDTEAEANDLVIWQNNKNKK